jgi:hypothetical protein
MGGTPVGAPLVGAAADALGPRSTLFISAIAGFAAFGIGLAWLFTERDLRFHRDRGLHLRVTHAGRPGVDDDPGRQTETLTAPISVLRRGDPLIGAGDSAPQDASVAGPATGIVPMIDPAPDDDSAPGPRPDPAPDRGPGPSRDPGAEPDADRPPRPPR